MRFLFYASFFLLQLLSTSVLTAQSTECGTDKLHEDLLLSDSMYKVKFLEKELNYREYMQSLSEGENPADSGYFTDVNIIPVVVHIIHQGEAIGVGSNIADSYVFNAIETLNQRFNGSLGSGPDIGIQFCLVQRDPSGNLTNGIDRLNGNIFENYVDNGINYYDGDGCDGASYTDIASFCQWDRTKYYNIYVVNTIDCGTGPAAFAYYPSNYDNESDGTYIRYTSFIAALGTTLSHEIGHAFNLPHTFSGDGGGLYCPIDTNCLLNGDFVCDTPPHKSTDCGLTNPCSDVEPFSNSKNNYMSYCPSKVLFTEGQKERMLFSLSINSRSTLLSHSWVCDPPTDIDLILNTTQNIPFINESCDQIHLIVENNCDSVITSFEIHASSNGTSIYSHNYITNLLPGASMNLSIPITISADDSIIHVYCFNPNLIGIYDKDPLNDLEILKVLKTNTNICENFEDDYLSNGWEITGTMDFVPFELGNNACTGNFIYNDVNCYFDLLDTMAINQLVSSFDLTNNVNYVDAILEFDLASKNDYYVDVETRFLLFASGCDGALDTLLNLSGAELATVPGTTSGCLASDWMPASCSEFETFKISLCQYMGDYVTLIFEIQSEYGSSQVYLDNICISKIPIPNTIPLIQSCDSTLNLIANPIDAGYWQILAGDEGFVEDENDAYSIFTGIPGNSYLLSWNYYSEDCGILFSDTLQVNLIGLSMPVVDYSSTYCEGDTIKLTVSNDETNYNWSGPNDFSSEISDPEIINASELNSGIYSIYLTNDSGCYSDTLEFLIMVYSIPELPNIIGNDSVCAGEDLILFTDADVDNYFWDGPLGPYDEDESLLLNDVDFLNEGNYTLFVESNGCYSDTSSMNVIINPQPAGELIMDGDTDLCLNDTLLIGIDNDSLFYNWSTGDTTQFIQVTATGEYSVTIANIFGCIRNIEPVTVIVHNLPIVNFNIVDSMFCVNEDSLHLVYGSPIGGTYTGAGVFDDFFYPDMAPLGETYIYYTYTDMYGCSKTVSDSVNIVELPVVSLDFPFDSVCVDDGIFSIDYGEPEGGAYSGDGVIGNYFDPSLTELGIQSIQYIFTDVNGCTNLDSALFKTVECESNLLVEELGQQGQVFVIPNPNSGKFDIRYIAQNSADINIYITSINGRVIGIENFNSINGVNSFGINIENIPAGYYLVRLTDNDKTWYASFTIIN